MNRKVSVLAAIDFSPHARAAVARACELALVSDASVHLVHAVDDATGPWDAASDSSIRDAAQRALETLRNDCVSRGVKTSAVCEAREPVELILETATRMDAGLIIMGRHGDRRPTRTFLGSVAERTIRAASLPVMTVFEGEPESRSEIRRILLATDFSTASDRALDWTFRWARRLEADVEVFHAVSAAIPASAGGGGIARPAEDARENRGTIRNRALDRLQSILARMSEAGIPASADLTHGAASVEIAKRAAEARADLVVMGGQRACGSARSGFGRVAAHVLRAVKTSVLLVPG